jgi:hypothetical protein
MAKQAFKSIKFKDATLATIEKCNRVLGDYAAKGYDMTLRQLYYQLVSAGEIPNNVREYKKLGDVVNDARLAGLIDWDAIVDRTRNLKGLPHWNEPSEVIDSAAWSYRIDRWADQPYRVEVWIEKDALAGVFQRVCNKLDVPFFSCRGYTSQSEMYSAAQRLRSHSSGDQQPYILHFGDHDPSGIDMSRDITDRLAMFGARLEFKRMALNMDQVEKYDPPPNPAKLTDSRCAGYIERFGDESWELDALQPDVLAGLVEKQIKKLIDADKWKAVEARETEEKAALKKMAKHFHTVAAFVRTIDSTKEDGPKECLYCGEEFEPEPDGYLSEYCSDRCFDADNEDDD